MDPPPVALSGPHHIHAWYCDMWNTDPLDPNQLRNKCNEEEYTDKPVAGAE
jgi:hypothetical protein